MQKLIKDNYQSVLDRGLITKETTQLNFYFKLLEENSEILNEIMSNDKEKLSFEIADVILTALNFATHFNIDIEKYLKEKIEINFKRAL